MAGPSEQQERALRERLSARTPPEWDRGVQSLDRALVEGRDLELTAEQYEHLLAPVIRLRLRRALTHALADRMVSSAAAAQMLGYLRDAELEDLLDGRRFPNLASPDFEFLRSIKGRLHQDVRLLKAAAT